MKKIIALVLLGPACRWGRRCGGTIRHVCRNVVAKLAAIHSEWLDLHLGRHCRLSTCYILSRSLSRRCSLCGRKMLSAAETVSTHVLSLMTRDTTNCLYRYSSTVFLWNLCIFPSFILVIFLEFPSWSSMLRSYFLVRFAVIIVCIICYI